MITMLKDYFLGTTSTLMAGVAVVILLPGQYTSSAGCRDSIFLSK
jgi:hypothetical protein